ncbi:peptidylprolyl isomerase [Candidatus Woesearchaeota archaeon]|nr:peptidylprolyl isomerase [Candidatus Woesearchaeota archaeon]
MSKKKNKEEGIKKKDFIEIDYSGIIKETNQVFDTTKKETAMKEKIYNKNIKYKPIIICVGENQVVRGLDKALEGKNTGDNFKTELKPEEAFGKKKAELLKLISKRKFREQNINPLPGMEVNIDNQMGIIRSSSGGRVIVDFNHPLANKEIIYEVTINKKIKDTQKQIESLMEMWGIPSKEVKIDKENKKAILKFENPKIAKNIIPVLGDKITKKIEELCNIKKVDFK